MGLTWQNGKQLKTITGASYGGDWGTVSMEYDYSGHRTSKHREGGINTCDQYYYWQGDILLAEVHGGIFLYYYYDETGVCGFNRAGTDYYFQKNMFGDIIAIYNTSGMKVGSYEYDAWGNTTVTNYTSDIIADWNPFRYRGYYQDQETGFYYLQSRYYDPQTGRFISADEPMLATLGLGIVQGSNLYSYCYNNPVMYTDETGQFAIGILTGLGIAAGIGALVGAAAYTISEVISYGITDEWSWSWGMFAGSILGGAIGGAVSFIPGIGLVLAAGITGLASSAIGMGLENAFGEANHSGLDILLTSLLVGGISMATAGILKAIPIQGLNAGRGSFQQITRQINTKFLRGQISRITVNTFGKMLTYNLFYSSLGSIANGFVDATQNYWAWRNRNIFGF